MNRAYQSMLRKKKLPDLAIIALVANISFTYQNWRKEFILEQLNYSDEIMEYLSVNFLLKKKVKMHTNLKNERQE